MSRLKEPSTWAGVSGAAAALAGAPLALLMPAQPWLALLSALAHANNDIIEIRASLVAPETLRRLGIDVDDHPASRADFEHLRASRVAAEENKPLLAEAKKTILTGLLAAALAWLGPTIVERIKADVSTPQPAAGKRQEKSE